MPRIDDGEWRRMIDQLPDLIHRRGDRREARLLRQVDLRFHELEKQMALNHAQAKALLDEAVAETLSAKGRVESMSTLLTETLKKIDDMAANADDLEDFREGLSTITNAAKSEAVAAQAVNAVNANPGPGEATVKPVEVPAETNPTSTQGQ